MSGGRRLIRTARLTLSAVTWADLADFTKLKRDPQAFAQMLGGVRTPSQALDDMANDVAFWGRTGIGLFAIREQGVFRGMTGLHERPDGRGIGLRFALYPTARGRGLAREAAGAALRFGHDEGWERIVGVTREDNRSSRLVLGGIGMVVSERFERDGNPMLTYASVRETERPGEG